MNLLTILRNEGVQVNEIAGWPNRHRPGTFTPIGILNHHTGGRDSLGTCINGRPDLPGPLCQLHIPKTGIVNLISDGRCNHAGAGAQRVLDDLRRDVAPRGDARDLGYVDGPGGNQWLYGIEVENTGSSHDPYPAAQLGALIRCNVAIARWKGWTAARSIHHREWTRRKPDMSWRGDLRSLVAARLTGQPTPQPQPEPQPQPVPAAELLEEPMITIRTLDQAGINPAGWAAKDGSELSPSTRIHSALVLACISTSAKGKIRIISPDTAPQDPTEKPFNLKKGQPFAVGGWTAGEWIVDLENGIVEAETRTITYRP